MPNSELWRDKYRNEMLENDTVTTDHEITTTIPDTFSKRIREREEQKRNAAIEQDARVRSGKLRSLDKEFSIRQLLAIAGMISIIAVLLLEYIGMEATVGKSIAGVKALQVDYEKLLNSNNQKEAAITAGIDIEEIYRIATEDLGMTYPERYQVITYEKTESEYIHQNEDIPE